MARHGKLRRCPASAGLFVAGSWHEAISAFSENPDAVYSFLSFMVIKPISIVERQQRLDQHGSRLLLPVPVAPRGGKNQDIFKRFHFFQTAGGAERDAEQGVVGK